MDIGCSNGRQTRFFAQHFSKVIGVDVSEAAIALARKATSLAAKELLTTLTKRIQRTILEDKAEFHPLRQRAKGVKFNSGVGIFGGKDGFSILNKGHDLIAPALLKTIFSQCPIKAG